jgi:hypothetical protein
VHFGHGGKVLHIILGTLRTIAILAAESGEILRDIEFDVHRKAK